MHLSFNEIEAYTSNIGLLIDSLTYPLTDSLTD